MKKPVIGRTQVERPTSVFAGFSVDHAARVTGLTKSRLTRWDKLGFFSPEYLDEEDRGNPYSRVYSFTDLVGLRTLAVLTDKYHVPLKELIKAAQELEKRVTRPWSDEPLAVLKRQVIFDLRKAPQNADGQYALKSFPLSSIAGEVTAKVEKLRSRKKSLFGKSEQHKFVAHNAVVLAGTRIPVAAVRSFVDAGYTNDDILKEYPSLTATDIQFVRRKRAAA